MNVLLLALLIGCGGSPGGADAGGRDDGAVPPRDGARPGDDAGSPADGGAGRCDLICGMPAMRDPGAGLATVIPTGCGGGTFSRSASIFLDSDGAKLVPILADMDGNGVLDLVANPRKLASAVVYPGMGGGRFGAASILPPGAKFAGGWGIDVGDFDGDGRLDVAAGDHNVGALAWRNLGGLSFALVSGGLPTGGYSGVGLGDVDQDGDLDMLVGADQFNAGGALVLGDGAGGWTAGPVPPMESARNAGHFVFADMDRDGDRDAIAFGQRTGGVSAFVLRAEGSGLVAGPIEDGGSGMVLGNPVQGMAGDVDCDGTPDLATGGTVHTAAGPIVLDGANVSHLADMDGDGWLDVITHGVMTGLRLYRNIEGDRFEEMPIGLPDSTSVPEGITPTPTFTPLADAYGIDVADLDGDGRLDVVRGFCASDVETFTTRTWCYLEAWVRR